MFSYPKILLKPTGKINYARNFFRYKKIIKKFGVSLNWRPQTTQHKYKYWSNWRWCENLLHAVDETSNLIVFLKRCFKPSFQMLFWCVFNFYSERCYKFYNISINFSIQIALKIRKQNLIFNWKHWNFTTVNFFVCNKITNRKNFQPSVLFKTFWMCWPFLLIFFSFHLNYLTIFWMFELIIINFIKSQNLFRSPIHFYRVFEG